MLATFRYIWIAVAIIGLCTLAFAVAARGNLTSLAGRRKNGEGMRLPDYYKAEIWASLARYRQDNAKLGPPAPGEERVVFYGDSISEAWAAHFATMFPGKPYIGRGVGGQTTPQMLVRFRQDAIALQPAVIVILAGTNDIAGNTGPTTQEAIAANIRSMVELAQASGSRVVLASVLPTHDYPWRPGLAPGPKIVALNAWIKEYAATVGAVYLDYHSALADDRLGLPAKFSADGVHPNEAGYRVMAPLVERAIARALSQS